MTVREYSEAQRQAALRKIGPLRETWTPKPAPSHPGYGPTPNLIRLVQDAAPVAMAEVEAEIKAAQQQQRDRKAQLATLKQLANVVGGSNG